MFLNTSANLIFLTRIKVKTPEFYIRIQVFLYLKLNSTYNTSKVKVEVLL